MRVVEVYQLASEGRLDEAEQALVRHGGPAGRAALKQMIRNPLYRGKVRLGDCMHDWPPYRYVDDALWYEAQLPFLPSETARAETQLETMVDVVGITTVLAELVASGNLPCRACGGPLSWNGHARIGPLLVPQLICSAGHTQKWLCRDDVESGLSRHACFGCGNDDQRRFRQWRRGPFWFARCASCGWSTGKVPLMPFGRFKDLDKARNLYGLPPPRRPEWGYFNPGSP